MNDESDTHNLIDELVDDFITRKQAGEAPVIEEYCRRFPHLAQQIRPMFATLAMIEDHKPDAGVPAAGAHELPERIGGYRIHRLLGHGGMGVVYEAEHESLGRRVALKVLAKRLSADESARTRFEREARAVASMNHPNIVPLFEVGEDDGQYFLAMQLITGRGLEEVCTQLARSDSATLFRSRKTGETDTDAGSRTLSGNTPATAVRPGSSLTFGANRKLSTTFSWIAQLGLQAADALTYAHERGIIHRDVKPSNFLLDEANVLWLTDFGLAKTDDEGLTQTGEFLGTLRYMAPERFTGTCDIRADIYALGLTLYELLVRQPAFSHSDRLALLEAIHTMDPPRPRAIDRTVPRDLETIIRKSIEKDPAARYVSARALGDDLQRYLNDEPIHARPATLPERFTRWTRRNRSLAASLLAVALLLLLLTAGASMAYFREARLRVNESQLRTLAEQRGAAITQQLYFSQMILAGQGIREPMSSGTVRDRLAEWTPGTHPIDYRGWEWFYLYSLVHREDFVSPKQDDWTWSVDFSPDNKHLVASVNGFGFRIWDLTTHRLMAEKRTGSMRAVAISPDGKRLATTDFRGQAQIWSLQDYSLLVELAGHETRVVYDVAWSPDGTRIATSCLKLEGNPTVKLWDAETGEELNDFGGYAYSVRDVQWHPDGQHLVTFGAEGAARFWDPDTGQEVRHFHLAGGSEGGSISPDGRLMAAHAGDGRIGIWETATHKQTALIETGARTIYSLAWRPGTMQFATGHADGSVRIWDAESGTERSVFFGHNNQLRCVRWSSDGSQLATASLDQTIRVWRVDGPRPRYSLPAIRESISAEWSTDSRRLALARHSREEDVDMILVIDTQTEEQHAIFTGQGPARVVAWNHDNSKLACAMNDPWIRIVDANDQQTTTINLAEAEWCESLAWNHDSSQIAFCTSTGDLHFRDVINNRLIRKVPSAHGQSDNDPFSIHWCHTDGRLATAGPGGRVKVWDGGPGRLLWTTQERALAIRWSPDGRIIAVARDGSVIFRDADTGDPLKTLTGVNERFESVDWSPDATRLVTGSNVSICLWDPKSGHIAMRIYSEGHSNPTVRWSPDGRKIAAGTSGPLFLFDASIGYQNSQGAADRQ